MGVGSASLSDGQIGMTCHATQKRLTQFNMSMCDIIQCYSGRAGFHNNFNEPRLSNHFFMVYNHPNKQTGHRATMVYLPIQTTHNLKDRLLESSSSSCAHLEKPCSFSAWCL